MNIETSTTKRIAASDNGSSCEIIITDGVIQDILLGWYEIEKHHGLWFDAKLLIGKIISTVSSQEQNRERLIGRLRGLRNAIDEAISEYENPPSC